MQSRSAIVVKPKQAFLDRLHAADPSSRDLTLLDLVREPTIYLIPECDRDDDLAEEKRSIPAGVFTKCPGCRETLRTADVEKNANAPSQI